MNNLSSDEINRLIEENTSIIHYVIRRYFPMYIGDEDIIQVGRIGLWKAIISYEENHSTLLSTYAVYVIRNEITHEARYRDKISNINPLSLDATLTNQNYEDTDTSLADIIGTRESGIVDSIHVKEMMNTFLSKLDDREGEIFKLYTLGHNQESISQIIGTSRTNVTRLLKNIKSKLYELAI